MPRRAASTLLSLSVVMGWTQYIRRSAGTHVTPLQGQSRSAPDQVGARRHSVLQLFAGPRRWLMTRGPVGKPDAAGPGGRQVTRGNLRSCGSPRGVDRPGASWFLLDHDRATHEACGEHYRADQAPHGHSMSRPTPSTRRPPARAVQALGELEKSGRNCYKDLMIGPDDFRRVMSHFATGVTIITAWDADHRP